MGAPAIPGLPLYVPTQHLPLVCSSAFTAHSASLPFRPPLFAIVGVWTGHRAGCKAGCFPLHRGFRRGVGAVHGIFASSPELALGPRLSRSGPCSRPVARRVPRCGCWPLSGAAAAAAPVPTGRALSRALLHARVSSRCLAPCPAPYLEQVHAPCHVPASRAHAQLSCLVASPDLAPRRVPCLAQMRMPWREPGPRALSRASSRANARALSRGRLSRARASRRCASRFACYVSRSCTCPVPRPFTCPGLAQVRVPCRATDFRALCLAQVHTPCHVPGSRAGARALSRARVSWYF